MKLTLGMAVYDDFDGPYFTIQSLALHHDLRNCEIVVVDNKPSCPAGEGLKAFLKGVPNARYIEMPTPEGTAAPRNRVFAEARGDAVVCMDSHVLLPPGTVDRLKQFYTANPTTRDLYHGPVLWDDLRFGATHFDDYWRGEMWGIWGQAWLCKCWHGQFSILADDGHPTCRFVALGANSQSLAACPTCGTPFPTDIPFVGHEVHVERLGHSRIGLHPDDEPFEITGQGLGLFTCRKDAWLGFNEHFRGFGGEELYIHEKFRRAAAKVVLLPFLRWHHRFHRPTGAKYPIHRWHKVRNYVIGYRELGLDLKPIEEHFIDNGLLPRDQYEKILADVTAEAVPTTSAVPQLPTAPTRPMPPSNTISSPQAAQLLLNWCKGVPRDINEHLVSLADLAAQCQHVTEFSDRRESTVGLLAGVMRGGGKLVSYQTESDALLDQMKSRFKQLRIDPRKSKDVDRIEPTDMLFLDSSPHDYATVWSELEKFASAVRRFIVLHDTISYGKIGEGGVSGLWDVVRDFTKWPDLHSEWFVAHHTNQQHGLTVLSRDAVDRPEQLIRFWQLGFGPGTELKKLLEKLDITEKPGCDCNAKANQMDEWGVAGCREHFDEIVDWMRDGFERWGWKDKLNAAAKAVQTGIAFQINWADPFPGLIRLAIANAEAANA